MSRDTGAFLIIAGLILGLVVLSLSLNTDGGDGGGILLIGPIPIIFGSSPKMTLMMVFLGAGLMVLATIFLLVWRKLLVSDADESKNIHGQYEEGPEGNLSEVKELTVKGGGVVMIGPIPIVFGSDPRIAILLMLAVVTLMLLWIAIIL